MREMKDSFTSWTGLIPKSWSVIGFNKAILRMATGLNPRENFQLSKDEEYYYITIRNFKNGVLFLDENCDRISPQAWQMIQERSQLRKGDILFASISKDGQVYLLENDPVNWNINESVFCIRINKKFFDERFFCYHLINPAYYSDLLMDATGSTFQSIKQNKLKNSFLIMPPISEQRRVADQLDELCSQVDRLIVNEQTQIEKLKTYKQSLVTEVVTKGLDPSVPMKDSGVEWIGEIPEHWSLLRGKALFVETDARSEDGSEELLTVSQYTGVTPRSQKNVNMFEALTLEGYKVCEIGDIAANTMWLWAGAIGVSEYHGVISPSYNVYRQRNADYYPKYLDYLLRAPMLVQEYASRSTGIRASRLRLYPQDFFDILFPVPPKAEQEAMVNYLQAKYAVIDKMISIKQSKIDKLNAYKKSMIYECVTGKKEVLE